MKSRNHPGKKNARRISVSLRLATVLAKETDPEKIEILKHELERVNAKIVPEEAARGRRTKKVRRSELWNSTVTKHK